jgi:hypothetical protein
MRLTLGRGWWRRVPIHDTWRREHNIWAGRWGVRITVRIRGRRIVPRIGARRRWIRCTWKGLGRVLGKRRRVGYLFSPRGSGRLFLVAAHELLSGVGVVLRRWHGEGHKNVEDYAGHDDFVEQEQGEDGWESDKRTAYLGCGRSGFQDLVAAQTQLATLLRLNFAGTWLVISRLQPTATSRYPCLKRCGGGVPRGDDDDEGWGDASARVKVANWCQPTRPGKPFLSAPIRSPVYSSPALVTAQNNPLSVLNDPTANVNRL